MKKNCCTSKRFQRLLGQITLLLLVILLVIKLWLRHCSIWLCIAFVSVVVSYAILSDGGIGMKDK